jgi:hypothetical protein
MLRRVGFPIRSATPDRNLPADEPDYTAQHSVSRSVAKASLVRALDSRIKFTGQSSP